MTGATVQVVAVTGAAAEEELGRCQSGSGGSGSESVAKVAQEAQSHLNVVA